MFPHLYLYRPMYANLSGTEETCTLFSRYWCHLLVITGYRNMAAAEILHFVIVVLTDVLARTTFLSYYRLFDSVYTQIQTDLFTNLIYWLKKTLHGKECLYFNILYNFIGSNNSFILFIRRRYSYWCDVCSFSLLACNLCHIMRF